MSTKYETMYSMVVPDNYFSLGMVTFSIKSNIYAGKFTHISKQEIHSK